MASVSFGLIQLKASLDDPQSPTVRPLATVVGTNYFSDSPNPVKCGTIYLFYNFKASKLTCGYQLSTEAAKKIAAEITHVSHELRTYLDEKTKFSISSEIVQFTELDFDKDTYSYEVEEVKAKEASNKKIFVPSAVKVSATKVAEEIMTHFPK